MSSPSLTDLTPTVVARGLRKSFGARAAVDGVYGELSVGENIRFYAAMYGIRDGALLREVLELVELDHREASAVDSLSGGMRRRLSLACALVHRPAVIFLDEPTVGVDPVLRVQLWQRFHELAAAGATLVVSSHVMDEADRCDELILMRDGHVVAAGSAADLRARAGTDDLEVAFLTLATSA